MLQVGELAKSGFASDKPVLKNAIVIEQIFSIIFIIRYCVLQSVCHFIKRKEI
jgi:uncharacterized membrane protein YagU involved in acid resistance